MKIGIDARMLGFTGVGRYIQCLLIGLSELSGLYDNNEYIIFVNKSKLNNIKLPKRGTFKQIYSKPFSIKEQLSLPLAIKKEKLDLFHCPHWDVPISFFGNLVLTIHDLTPLIYPNILDSKLSRLTYNSVLKAGIKKARRIITVSENTKKDIKNLLGVRDEKITVIYEGIDKTRYRPITNQDVLKSVRKKYQISGKFIFYVGQWKPHKNIINLIEAFHKLLRESKIDHKLVIGGEKDNRYPQIPNLVKKLGLEKEVIFPGHISDEDLPGLYNAADLFVFPSFYEGFGLPVLEAMACRTPVVCSSTSSLPEVAGNAAILVNPFNVNEMAEAIYKGITNENLRTRLIEKGFERVKLFSCSKMAEQTIAVYKSSYQETKSSYGD